MAKQTRPEREYLLERARLRHQTVWRLLDGLFSVMRTAIRAAAVVACSVCLYFIASELAGKKTEVVTLLNAFVRLGADRWAYLIVIALLGGGFWRERRVRKSQSKELGGYAKELEKRLDPNRTSSRLTETGEPDVRDRDG